MAKTVRPAQTAHLDTADKLLPVNEVADFLGTHRAFVYRLMASGELPYTLIGTRRRVRMSDVQAYVDRRVA
jgi:excisionase family DNA binding protein